MSLQETPSAERVQIGIFGRRNAGKSSLINAITGQALAVVSEVGGTTTDPVRKAMELLPLGPVVLIDTPGMDDAGALGALRIQKSMEELRRVDIAVAVIDAKEGIGQPEKVLFDCLEQQRIPVLSVVNKSELLTPAQKEKLAASVKGALHFVSAGTGEGIAALKEAIAAAVPQKQERPLVRDLLAPGDFAVLVVPLDSAAPKGRLILPQQQTIRAILDSGAAAIVTRDTELSDTFRRLGKDPALVITDSQVFDTADRLTPRHIPLTSFSILFARYKGDLPLLVRGVTALRSLRDGDKILIAEGCTHHRQCEDIGTVKLPRMIRAFTKAEPAFVFTSGREYLQDISDCRMVLHCGGCTLPEKEMQYRIRLAEEAGVPITNYGISMAYMHGILPRALTPFADIAQLLHTQEAAEQRREEA